MLAKTDRVDARVLADMGRYEDLPVTRPPEPARQRLGEFLRRRQQLVTMLRAEERRLDDVETAEIRKDLRGMIRVLKRRIDKHEADIAALMETPELAEDARRVRTMPSLGPVISAVMIAYMPELGQLDRRKIASLAGLAPLARDSGTMRGKRTI